MDINNLWIPISWPAFTRHWPLMIMYKCLSVVLSRSAHAEWLLNCGTWDATFADTIAHKKFMWYVKDFIKPKCCLERKHDFYVCRQCCKLIQNVPFVHVFRFLCTRERGVRFSKLPSTPFSATSLILPTLSILNEKCIFLFLRLRFDFFFNLQMSGSLLRPLFGVLRLRASQYTHKGVSPLVCGCQAMRNYAQQTQVHVLWSSKGSGVWGLRTLCQKFFSFMQFLGQIGQIADWRPPP